MGGEDDHSGKNYRWSGEFIYCGKGETDAYPISIRDEEVVMEYRDRKSDECVRLSLYPFKEGELEGLLHEAGFGVISTYGDYEEHSPTPEFLTHVCTAV